MAAANERISLFNGFTLDRVRGCLMHSDEPVHLRPQSYKVLEYLVENSGRLVSKDTLIDAIWSGRAVTDGAVGKCIEELREVFGEDGRQYLQNIRGRGYIFDRDLGEPSQTIRETHSEEINLVRVIVEENGDFEPVVQVDPRRSFWTRTNTFALTVCLGVTILAGGYWLYSRRQPATMISSIAVLPLKNESGNEDVAYLSDGMTESLINRLARLPGLTIKARSTVFQYRGKDVDPRSIASELAVQAVLTGRFVQRGDDVTLYVSLVDGPSGNQLWGERYERKLDQLASLEKETATDIAEHLTSKVRPADEKRLAGGLTENSDAYLSYLKGRYFWLNARGGGYQKSLDFFQKAIELDPTYAPAYAGIGHYYGFGAASGMMRPDENWKRSEAAIRKALELDDSLAENFNALTGIQLYYYRDWKAAEDSFQRGLALGPASAEVHRHYAKCLILFGRTEEALTHIQRTIELEPLALSYNLDAAKVFFWARQYPKALEQLNNTLELNPTSLSARDLLATVHEKMGNQRAAIDEWSKLLTQIGQQDVASKLTSTYERLGFEAAKRIRGEQMLRRVDEQAKNGDYVAPFEYVAAYTMIGNREKAFEWLEKAVQEHTRFAFEFRIDPQYDSLRNNPRFQQLADSVKVN